MVVIGILEATVGLLQQTVRAVVVGIEAEAIAGLARESPPEAIAGNKAGALKGVLGAVVAAIVAGVPAIVSAPGIAAAAVGDVAASRDVETAATAVQAVVVEIMTRLMNI